MIFARFRKPLAAFFLCLLTTELVAPTVSYALTSGPDQPEMKGFTPIGSTDMVDLFSGDFNYNIPLLDVGGYPINLSYQSGAGMDDEASWVGLGWSLGPGALNRQLRGIPDDFNGSDTQEREMNMKDRITYGGRVYVQLDLLGFPVLKAKSSKRKFNFSNLTLSTGVKYDNYRGIGFDMGLNAGMSLTDFVAGDNNISGNLGAGLNLSNFEGASTNINAGFTKRWNDQAEKTMNLSRSIGLGMNSRAGLTGMTLGSSFSTSKTYLDKEKDVAKTLKYSNGASSTISFNGATYTPTISHPLKSFSTTFNFTIGPEVFIAFLGFGGSGFYSKQQIAEKKKFSPAYGYYHSSSGKDDDNALLDFNREKDVSYNEDIKAIPVPVPTYDLYSATSQNGAGQYRLFQGGSGVFFDQRVETNSDNVSFGVEAGAGNYIDLGADLDVQDINSTTKKWTSRNNFLSRGDFQKLNSSSPLYEPVYFKRIGEPIRLNESYLEKIKGLKPISVALPKNISDEIKGAEASDRLANENNSVGEATEILKKDARDVKNTTFLPLTAKEAAAHGLDKYIQNYYPAKLTGCADSVAVTFDRVSGHRKAHHFSEVTITGDDGKRSVYGIPVYNTYQEETTFSIGQDNSKRGNGLITYVNGVDDATSNTKGRDWYFSREKTPPYSTSHLLTAILSPDYVDVTGDGVSDDDLGTAVKFNYTKLPYHYRWRTPFGNGQDIANYNEGLLSDALDDKASYVYGEKEIWYLHSVESKTMVAHFITEERKDALGVLNRRGGVDNTNKLKSLKEIRLYSKSDLKANNYNIALTTPIKVVHFDYDYSLCTGLPNNLEGGGKLTLKRVYFTFGANQKGILNPYRFNYNTSYNTYDYRQNDRWGIFKQASSNPGGLNNSEFPYTLQHEVTDAYAGNWQLSQIKLPSGGYINVSYESDDYAYVQNKRASEMFFINGIGNPGDSTALAGAEYIYVNAPGGVSADNFKEKYLEGIKNLYFKCYLDVDARDHWEFVPGYAEIEEATRYDANTLRIKLKKIDGRNPIANAGWQFIRSALPKYAYPGSETLESTESDVKKTITTMVAAFKSINELFTGFNKRAEKQKYSDRVYLSKSWVRLCSPSMKKKGGGSRVKKVEISDNWADMTEFAGVKTATYTQLYDYTMLDKNGERISSGVASYEPMIGNDENPFRQPLRYKEKQILGLDNNYYIEEPFGESFFPAASVGYSKVSVRSLGAGDDNSVNRTGEVVSEFYTARDYPTIIKRLYLPEVKPTIGKWFALIGGFSTDMRGVSQGLSVELNDMHGKPKSVNVYNKSGQNISSQEFLYKNDNETAQEKVLNNEVPVIHSNGTVSNEKIGMDVEIFHDMREQSTINIGGTVKVSGGAGALLFFPLPFFFPGLGANYDKRIFRSTSTVKIIQRFGLQESVRKVENGSSITTENLLWDAETGNVLLSKTQNEFDDPVYSFAYPAHWKYDGMAQAYKNLGTVLEGFTTNASGVVSNSTYNAILAPGDELIDVNSGNKFWVIYSPVSSVYQNRIIDETGELQELSGLTLKLVRSGRRNMANTAIGTVVSLNNPILGDSISVSGLTRILDAKATVFSEEWGVPGFCTTCPDGYKASPDGLKCYLDTTPDIDTDPTTCHNACRGDSSESYSSSGGRIYNSGYSSSGSGSYSPLSDIFWKYDSSCNNTLMSRSAGMAPMAFIDCNMYPYPYDTSYTCPGPLNRTGLWVCKDSAGQRLPLNKWVGFNKCISFPATKTYYFGMAGDDQVRLIIDGVTIVHLSGTSTTNYETWHVYPVHLTSGNHTIVVEGYNASGPASFGAEIYNNTSAELNAATSYGDLNLIFSSRSLVGKELETTKYTCSSGILNTCDSPYVCRQEVAVNKIINPYYKGMLGNWRAQSQFVYQVKRENVAGNENIIHSTNIRKSGAYSEFNPFWRYDATTTNRWLQNPSDDARWIAANEVTQFNSKGLEVENRDALNRYSSAIFGYLESMPVAVASNARYREIAFDGFEDYDFELGCESDTCRTSHFDFKKQINGSSVIRSDDESHSGKYSLKLNGSTVVKKTVFADDAGALFQFDAGRYSLFSNEIAKGFSPIKEKKYVLSFWLKEPAAPRNPSTNFQIYINGNALLDNTTKWPIIEGWKRIEVQFTIPQPATGFSIELSGGGGDKFIDDFRIMPFDAQMKSFAYDPSSQRLMAELDENNFATFYEYDDEGTLIRVKKETERGIMTIKETRSSYIKDND